MLCHVVMSPLVQLCVVTHNSAAIFTTHNSSSAYKDSPAGYSRHVTQQSYSLSQSGIFWSGKNHTSHNSSPPASTAW